MGFLELIEKIQKKPEPFRQKIAFLVIFILMLVIVFVWLSTLNLSLNEEKKATGESVIGPFSVLIENFKEFGKIFKEGFQE